jgi:hypothetical protein
MIMKTSSAFQFSRFWALFRLMWASQSKWIYIILGITPILFLYLLFALENMNLENANSKNLFFVFYIAILLPLIFACNIFFTELKKPSSLRDFFLLPATFLEKWTAKMSIAMCIYPIISIAYNLIVFTIFQISMLHWFAFRFSPITARVVLNMILSIYLIGFLCIAINLLGKKSGFVAIFLVLILYFKFPSIIKSCFPYNEYEVTPLTGISLGGIYEYSEMANHWNTIYLMAYIAPIALFCISSYYLLKEKEAV